jgi:hypothetical protein
LLELARAKGEIARINLVPKRFPDLRDAERQLLARHIQHILELHENRLRRFGRRYAIEAGSADRAHCVWNIKLNGRASVKSLPPQFGHFHPIFFRELIGAQSRLAGPAIDHRIGKGIDVTARFQHRRMGQDRAVHPTTSSRSRTITATNIA